MASQIVSLRIIAGLIALILVGCAKARVTPIATGSARYPAAAASTVIETYFEGQMPSRQYEQVGIVRGHYSAATAWGTADVTNLLPELHAKGRELGADAIIITHINRYLGPALHPMARTIPNVDVTAQAIRYVPGELHTRGRQQREEEPALPSTPPAPHVEEIPLVKDASGLYLLPAVINETLTLPFFLDSGASEVNVPVDVALTLLRTGTIQQTDFLPGTVYRLADGSEVSSPRFLLRTLQVGSHIITDVPASIGETSSHPLLGQSLLERFGVWGIDNQRRTFLIGAGPQSLAGSAREGRYLLTGHWQGGWKSARVVAGGTLATALQQSDFALQGSMALTASGCFTQGTIYGTVISDTLLFRIDFGKGQWADLAGVLDASGRVIEGQYRVNGGPCGGDRGVWILRRT